MQDKDSGNKAIMIMLMILAGILLCNVSPVFSGNTSLPLKQLWKTGVNSSVSQIEISKNGKSFAAILKGKPKKRFGPYLEGNLLSLDPQTGKIKWKYVPKHRMFYMKISSDGEHILADEIADEFASDLYYFKSDGEVLWKKKDVGNFDMSEDGKLILVSPGLLEREKDSISLFNDQGNLLWRYMIREKGRNTFASITPNGRYVVAGSVVSVDVIFDWKNNIEYKAGYYVGHQYSRFVFYDKNMFIIPGSGAKAYDLQGNLVVEYKTDFDARYVRISPDKKYLITLGEDKAALFDIDGKLLWKIDFKKETQNAVISTKLGYVILGVDVDDNHSKLVFLDLKTGKKIGEKLYEGEGGIHLAMPGDEKYLAVACGKNIYYYRLLDW